VVALGAVTVGVGAVGAAERRRIGGQRGQNVQVAFAIREIQKNIFGWSWWREPSAGRSWRRLIILFARTVAQGLRGKHHRNWRSWRQTAGGGGGGSILPIYKRDWQRD